MKGRRLILMVMVVVLISSSCIGNTKTTEPPEPTLTQAPVQTTIASQITAPPTTTPTTTAPPPRPMREVLSQQEEIVLSDSFQRKFSWTYGGHEWYITMNFFPELYELYKTRSRERDYDLFASDPYDDELIEDIANYITQLGEIYGVGYSDIPYSVVSFVQSLPYTPDDVTTGFDEYPRFPYETLYDNGGDCEDTSILVTALLQELGYGVVLIDLPDHMAVGMKCSPDISGHYYMYGGERYCYLETTGENWDVGELPDEYKGQKSRIIPIYKRPVLDIKFDAAYEYNYYDTYVDVNVTVSNLGSEIAKNVKIYIALQTSDTSKVWDQSESEYLQIEPERRYQYFIENLHATTGEDFRIYVMAYGDNVISDEAVSNWVTWSND